MGDTEQRNKYQMRMSLNVLNHLGLNLYSNVPAVLSEIVANAYDADAQLVEIDLTNDRIVIRDDGNGMTIEEINNKYLYVGYQKRENNENISPVYKRKVMGRKGIGKLSIFSIANTIELHSIKNGQRNALKMNRTSIEREIKENNGTYHPEDIEPIEIPKGTTIILTDLKKSINKTAPYLKRRLARRFTVIGQNTNFIVKINGEEIGFEDRNYFKKIEFLWTINNPELPYEKQPSNIKEVLPLGGELSFPDIDGSQQKVVISGWIGTVSTPSDLDEDQVNNNKVSLIARGKMSQEDILDTYTEGGVYASYLIGEIHADFLDDDNNDDIATSSRQRYNEDDPRFVAVKEKIRTILKIIQGKWGDLRKKYAAEKIFNEMPIVKKWYDELELDNHKEKAKKIFKTIDSVAHDKKDPEIKKTLVKQAILGFEQLKIRDRLGQIDKISTANDIELLSIFSEINQVEASLYHDIVTGRLRVIRELKEKIETNELEKVLQNLIFDNLWLLNPMWERATKASEYREKTVQKAFQQEVDTLSEDEKKARIDIGYRTSAGKHIIIELKRYNPSYKITPFSLAAQVDKYKKALEKVLTKSSDNPTPYIEVVCVLGDYDKHYKREEFNEQLRSMNGRIYPYDQLIQESLESYAEYLEREEKVVGRLKSILDEI